MRNWPWWERNVGGQYSPQDLVEAAEDRGQSLENLAHELVVGLAKVWAGEENPPTVDELETGILDELREARH